MKTPGIDRQNAVRPLKGGRRSGRALHLNRTVFFLRPPFGGRAGFGRPIRWSTGVDAPAPICDPFGIGGARVSASRPSAAPRCWDDLDGLESRLTNPSVAFSVHLHVDAPAHICDPFGIGGAAFGRGVMGWRSDLRGRFDEVILRIFLASTSRNARGRHDLASSAVRRRSNDPCSVITSRISNPRGSPQRTHSAVYLGESKAFVHTVKPTVLAVNLGKSFSPGRGRRSWLLLGCGYE